MAQPKTAFFNTMQRKQSDQPTRAVSIGACPICHPIATIQYSCDLQEWHNQYSPGLKEEITCVPCGVFTENQFERTKETYNIRPNRILSASLWLQKNNPCYARMEIPKTSIVHQSIIPKHTISYVHSEDTWLFGITQGFIQATEEQSRRTLHVHFLVWIQE